VSVYVFHQPKQEVAISFFRTVWLLLHKKTQITKFHNFISSSNIDQFSTLFH